MKDKQDKVEQVGAPDAEEWRAMSGKALRISLPIRRAGDLRVGHRIGELMNTRAVCKLRRKQLYQVTKCALSAVLLFAAVSLLGCATTSSGVNRQQLSIEKQVVTLPFKVIVDENGASIESVGTAEKVNYKDLVFVSGVHSVWIGPLTKNETAVALIRGKFAAGKAFEEIAKSLSSPAQGAPAIKLNLLRFKHFGSAKTPGCTGVNGIMVFAANFSASDQSTISSYAFEWETKGTFFPSQERDILKEIVEQALLHWARQFGKIAAAESSADIFPPTMSGEFSVGSANYAYVIFKTSLDGKE